MDQRDDQARRIVRDYHERTKHHPTRFAASPGYLDWANQPDPFRRFIATDPFDLPRPQMRPSPSYDELFGDPVEAAALDADLVGRLFLHSLALSAWKQAPGTRPWSLRINPSSGDLHPTEAYLISDALTGLFDRPGVFHYAPFNHRLERRCDLTDDQWAALTADLPTPSLLIGLTSIYWREAWKYGERAFRYCHLDVGHAIGALAFSGRTLGWDLRLLDCVAPDDLDRLLGTCRQSGIEAEHADCLLLLQPADVPSPAADVSTRAWRRRIAAPTVHGTPNMLSQDHQAWPVIEQVALATRADLQPSKRPAPRVAHSPATTQPGCPKYRQAAERIIRQRRSAVAMDGVTTLDSAAFMRMLSRILPTAFPFTALPWPPRVSLAVFVHRIRGLSSGFYLLARDPGHEPSLRASLDSELMWEEVEDLSVTLPFYRLLDGDTRQAAKLISCDQDIAADGAFALGMLGAFDETLDTAGAAGYPRLYWECGLIGQVLYLEAEAAGMRATGIGCFFDDLMHELLGISDHRWQSLYHFTVGGALDDDRLQTIAPYAHLANGGDS